MELVDSAAAIAHETMEWTSEILLDRMQPSLGRKTSSDFYMGKMRNAEVVAEVPVSIGVPATGTLQDHCARHQSSALWGRWREPVIHPS